MHRVHASETNVHVLLLPVSKRHFLMHREMQCADCIVGMRSMLLICFLAWEILREIFLSSRELLNFFGGRKHAKNHESSAKFIEHPL